MRNQFIVSIETLHLIAGFSLVLAGILVYFIEGVEMALSWLIFGAMYISMSDIGENEMSHTQLLSRKHQLRRFFGYFGAIASVSLLLFYLYQLI